MSKIAEQKAWQEYPIPLDNDPFISKGFIDEKRREGYIVGYSQALSDIKQRVKEIINNQEKEWGKPNVDIGLYTILGHIVETEEEL
jgi:hypothetical protein